MHFSHLHLHFVVLALPQLGQKIVTEPSKDLKVKEENRLR